MTIAQLRALLADPILRDADEFIVHIQVDADKYFHPCRVEAEIVNRDPIERFSIVRFTLGEQTHDLHGVLPGAYMHEIKRA